MAIFQFNDSGEGVERLQAALAAAGFNPGNIDGSFGSGTSAAVVAFQKSQGLVPDGIAGLPTSRHLSQSPGKNSGLCLASSRRTDYALEAISRN
jgi:peptidoglycan hydrolase-like protein with peptidoglycan-binding domain